MRNPHGLRGIAHWRNLDGGSFLLSLYFQSGDGWVGSSRGTAMQPETESRALRTRNVVFRALCPIALSQILPCRAKPVPISTPKWRSISRRTASRRLHSVCRLGCYSSYFLIPNSSNPRPLRPRPWLGCRFHAWL